MTKVNVGVIGCGKQAQKHVKALKLIDGVDEIVVYDVTHGAAKSLSASLSVKNTDRIDDVFSGAIDGVVVCTPPETHLNYVNQALNSGKHVFCEKPLCLNLNECLEILALEKQTEYFVQVGYVYRYVEAFKKLKQMLLMESCPLGKPVSAIFRIGGRGSHQLWKHRKHSNGGAMNEMLVHMLDLSIWLFGPIKTFNVLESSLVLDKRVINGQEEQVDADDYVVATGETDSGVRLLFQADMITPAFRQLVELQGDNGSFVGSIQSEVESFIHTNAETEAFQAGRTPLNNSPVNLFHEQMVAFVDNLKIGKNINSATVKDSMELLKLVGN